MFDEKLARVLNFTEEDLTANRQGYMTKKQRVKLRTMVRKRTIYQPLGVFWIYLAVIFFLIFSGAADTNGRDMRGIVAVGFVVASVAMGIYTYYAWRRLHADLHKGDVAMEAGRIALEVGMRGKNSLTVQYTTFSINAETLLAFRNDAHYRIYYAPHTKLILSAESMKDE
jgi:hypothetical protein